MQVKRSLPSSSLESWSLAKVRHSCDCCTSHIATTTGHGTGTTTVPGSPTNSTCSGLTCSTWSRTSSPLRTGKTGTSCGKRWLYGKTCTWFTWWATSVTTIPLRSPLRQSTVRSVKQCDTSTTAHQNSLLHDLTTFRRRQKCHWRCSQSWPITFFLSNVFWQKSLDWSQTSEKLSQTVSVYNTRWVKKSSPYGFLPISQKRLGIFRKNCIHVTIRRFHLRLVPNKSQWRSYNDPLAISAQSKMCALKS